MPSAGQDYYERLQTALEELEDARSEYSRVARRRDELQKQIDGEEPTFGLLGSAEDTGGEGETSNASIEASEQELARLLLKYTEKHPEVIAVRERIAQLRRQQRERLAAAGSGADRPSYELNTELMSMNSLDLNPVYQSLKISISQANAELSELEEEVTDAEQKVSYLRRMVDTIPEVEAQLARLNRDYDVNKAQHTALLRRLESARLSEQVDSQSEEMKFQIIEPPLVPLEPTGPNRYLFSTAVLIAGVGIGGALSWFLNLINPAFNTIEDLRRKLQLPVLGSVSVFRSQADQKENRRKWRRFGFASALLLVAYSAAMFSRPATEFVRTALLDGGML
jgi:polysaccharide chain length determinant protein (PEP-CTERM system associated)